MIYRFLDWLLNLLGMKDKQILLRPQPDGTWKPEIISKAKAEWLKRTGEVVIVEKPDDLRRVMGAEK